MAQTMGDRIRQAREAKGLSQEAAARLAGVALMTWNRWETGGIKSLQSKRLGPVARVLDVSETWLLEGTETEAPSGPPPPGWVEFAARRPDLVAQLSPDDQARIRAYAARYYFAKTWDDFESAVLRHLNKKPSLVHEAKRQRRGKES